MLAHWIWYAMLPQMRSYEKRMLLERFSDSEEIFHLAKEALDQCEDLTEQTKAALMQRDLREAENILQSCRRKQIGLITYGEDAYPRKLRNIEDPPMVLYYRGNLPDFEAQPVVAVVGTRKASAYGMGTAGQMAQQIAACGALVATGGASGIDTAAMESVLNSGDPVVCVLGCGVDVAYPRNNKKLFERTLENGCLLSEYPPETKPLRWNFPRRNRILSGISNGVLVVEAPAKSGALITAEYALGQGRDVFVVPGNINVESCAGSNALLQDYAAAACSGWDVVKDYASLYPGKIAYKEALPLAAQEEQIPAESPKPQKVTDKKHIDKADTSPYSKTSDLTLTPEEQVVLNCVTSEPILIDDILSQVDVPAGKALATLTMLALKGIVTNHPGRRVSLNRNSF